MCFANWHFEIEVRYGLVDVNKHTIIAAKMSE